MGDAPGGGRQRPTELSMALTPQTGARVQRPQENFHILKVSMKLENNADSVPQAWDAAKFNFRSAIMTAELVF